MNKFLAQNLTLPDGTQLPFGLKNTTLLQGGKITIGSILAVLIKFIFPLAGVGLLIVIISAGFTLLTSAGDAKKMEKGKQTLTQGVIGFIVIFLAYWIVQAVGIIFGVTEIQQTFK